MKQNPQLTQVQIHIVSQGNSNNHIKNLYILATLKKKKTEEARTLPNSFYEANITQIPSQTRTYKNENDRPISLRDTEFLNSQQSISKPNSTKNQDFMPLSSEI